MDWLKDIDWGGLREPNEFFRVMMPENPNDPQDPFYLKMVKFKRMLMDRYLWIPDEYRSPEGVDSIINSYFQNIPFTVLYEVGDFQGMVAFVNIMPAYKCEVTFKIWDKKLWGKSFVRAGREILDIYQKEFRLKRIGTSSADRRMVKFARMFGFKDEGELPHAFRYKNKFYTKYLLGRYGE